MPRKKRSNSLGISTCFYSGPIVFDRETCPLAAVLLLFDQPDKDMAAWWCVMDGVGEQDAQNLPQQVGIGVDKYIPFAGINVQFKLVGMCERYPILYYFRNDLR